MKCELIDARELGALRVQAWERLLGQAPVSRNPNLSPWFALALAEHRPTKVGMLWEGRNLLAVLPFNPLDDGRCEALALGVSDYHGPVFHNGCGLGYREFLRNLGIREFHFDHLLADFRLKGLLPGWLPTHVVNLAKGETSYRWELRRRGSGLWPEMCAKLRRVQRDLGGVRFLPSLREPDLLEQLIEWKSRQFRRTGVSDDFDLPWNRPFLHTLLQVRRRSCTGLLSGLFAGGKLLALHMGSCSPQVLQTCYTAYDPAFGDYSPGALLLFSQVRHCLRKGIPLLDLGKGEEPYKKRWANDCSWVAEGCLAV